MSTATCTTTVGVFSRTEDAHSAIAALQRAGFANSEIGIIHGDRKASTRVRDTVAETATEEDAQGAAGGAVAGAAAGLGIGTLIGAGVLSGVVPVIGPALFAGTLGVLASNAAGGAAVAGLVGALVGWEYPKKMQRITKPKFLRAEQLSLSHPTDAQKRMKF